MNKGLIFLPLLLAAGVYMALQHAQSQASTDDSLQEIFDKWAIQHNKVYSDLERHYRLAVFAENYHMIQKHNQQYTQGLHSYNMAVNKYADLTDAEFKSIHLVPLKQGKPQSKQITSVCHGHIQDIANPPESVDWSKRATTEVADEGSCGANWAFATTGAFEGMYALTKGRIIKFSDQQLLDCSSIYGNQGCQGGFMDQGFFYIIDDGITTAELYPYTQKVGKCLYKSTMRAGAMRNCAEVDPGNYTKLMFAVTQAPVAVAVDATNFRFYNDGVYSGTCGTDLNRGMLVVGFGNQDGKNYWNLKNSLGTNWGRAGYMLLQRDKMDGPGKCGIQMAAFQAQDVSSN